LTTQVPRALPGPLHSWKHSNSNFLFERWLRWKFFLARVMGRFSCRWIDLDSHFSEETTVSCLPFEVNRWSKSSLWSYCLSACDKFKPQL
jgi:hypothetical protein